MAGIKEYSTIAANNAAINSISIAEGCAPSGINDAIRQEMADTRSFYESGGWIDLGYTCTYASSTSITISGTDATAYFTASRRIRAVGSSTGTIYGKVASSSFSTNTTVNFTWDSGSLSNETLTISVGFINVTGYPIDVTAVKGAGAGTVTSIIAGTGLTGGTITTSGTVAVDTSVVGTKNAASTWTSPQRGTVTTDNDLSFDQSVTNNFFCTPSAGGTLTFTNHTAGQSGFVLLVNGSNYAITAAATTKINSADLTAISATGTYLLSYLDNGTNAYVVVSKGLTS
jgi:hypothetical protein